MNDHLNTIIRTIKCPVCGKEFVPAPEHAYKIYKNGKYKLACTYGCMRRWERENQPKTKKKCEE